MEVYFIIFIYYGIIHPSFVDGVFFYAYLSYRIYIYVFKNCMWIVVLMLEVMRVWKMDPGGPIQFYVDIFA